MEITKTQKLYGGKVTVDFYESCHRYDVTIGRKTWRPLSVTSVTGVIDKSTPLIIWATRLARDFMVERLVPGAVIQADIQALIEEACSQHRVKKEAAATSGKLAHAWIEDYAAGKKPALPKDEKAAACVTAFLRWMDDHRVKFLENELMVYSKKHDYVGLLDCLAKVDGKVTLLDWKTSKRVYSEMRYQVAAYQHAYEEQTGKKVDQRIIVRLGDDADFEAVELGDQKLDLAAFLGALTIKRRERELDQLSRIKV